MPGVGRVLLIVLVILRGASVHAEEKPQGQEEQQSKEEEQQEATDASKLEREFNDPLTTLPQFFFQDAYTPANYGTDAQTNRLIARAIIPRIPRFSLFPLVQLIRPTFSMVTVPEGRGSATRTEMQCICGRSDCASRFRRFIRLVWIPRTMKMVTTIKSPMSKMVKVTIGMIKITIERLKRRASSF